MRARIWGCRGSLATPGPETVRTGGNTSCVQVTLDDGTLIILDAGTGIRSLGMDPSVRDARKVHLLLTHLHLDHIEGLGFFGPLWDPGVQIDIWGPPSPMRTLERRLTRYLSPPLFPVHFRNIPSKIALHDAPEGEWRIGGARLLSQTILHNGPAVGYRISEGDATLAYLPDHEPSLGVPDLREIEPEWISGHAVARDADVLLHDSQYTPEEYEERVGWGHSSIEHVVGFAQAAQVRQLIMFHHDPLHTDEFLEAHRARAVELWGGGNEPILAREGMEIELPAGRSAASDPPAAAER